ncbi:MAG: sporulation protein YqfD [Oscillospiraceae bacterium]|nr:sporulation protein YqfD [Oscillospiraceae bacterium]
MRTEERIRGLVRVEAFGAEPEALLNACLAEDLPLLRPERIDAFTLRLGVFEGDLPRLQALAEKHFCTLRVLSRRGGSRDRRLLRRRAGLLTAGVLLLAALWISSLFVWEIRLVGAEGISRGELLRELEDCGLAIGSFRPGLDPDGLRDRMLLREDKLVWLRVNIRGSVAEVLLLPRAAKPGLAADGGPADLCAARTGIVRRVSALSGQPLVQPGTAVTEGEVLIAGTVDSITAAPRTLRARGEVWADTWYEISAVCPIRGKEADAGGGHSRLALKIGKKRINFYQNGGKAIDGCDKIVHEYHLGIHGLFRLPVTLVREELRPYEETEHGGSAEEIGQLLIAALAEHIDGQIVSAELLTSQIGGVTVVTLRAQCLENIARSVDIIQ